MNATAPLFGTIVAATWLGEKLTLSRMTGFVLGFAGVPPIAIATISQLSATIVLLLALPFTIPQAMPSAEIWLAVIALALFSTSIAYLLYFRLIQNIGSTKALTVTYLIPVSATIWGAIALGEPITIAMVFGGGLVLLGTAIANDLFRSLLK